MHGDEHKVSMQPGAGSNVQEEKDGESVEELAARVGGQVLGEPALSDDKEAGDEQLQTDQDLLSRVAVDAVNDEMNGGSSEEGEEPQLSPDVAHAVKVADKLATKKKTIAEMRTSAGLSQREMAEKLELPRTTYGDLERGKTPLSSERLQKIAEALGCSVDELSATTTE